MNCSSPPPPEPENSALGFLRLAPQAITTEQREEALARYEYHALKAQSFLLEAFALDEAAMDRHHPHLRKVHVPLRKPDLSISPGFTTVEAALLSAPRKPAPLTKYQREHVPQERDDARYQRQEPTYVSPYPRAALDKAAGRTRAEGAPKPWKDSK